MESFAKAAAIGVIASILAVLIRRYNKEQALMLSLFTAAAILIVFFGFFRSMRDLLQELEQATGVDSALITPVYKCVIISLISHFASNLCRDASEAAIAESITVLGAAASLYVCLPLFLSVLSLVKQLIGGGQ